MSRTTANMEYAFENAATTVKHMGENLAEVLPKSAIEGFWEAMRLGGAKPDVADEYFDGLRHAVDRINAMLTDLEREIGAAHHIVATGVHKTPNASTSGGRRHLVL